MLRAAAKHRLQRNARVVAPLLTTRVASATSLLGSASWRAASSAVTAPGGAPTAAPQAKKTSPRTAQASVAVKAGASLPSHKFVLSPEVLKAYTTDPRPIVALESTIISHGMPYPQNLSTAREVEEIIRQRGAVPATIALMDGRVHVGLSDADLQKFASTDPARIRKCSRRDLGYALATKETGATTVSGTMAVMNALNLKVFVTGGIGGVHRGAEVSMDVSADLADLGRTPITIVCAGVKSILDIKKTLEYLETQGVTVITYADPASPSTAKTSSGGVEFPAFFSPRSGIPSPLACADPDIIQRTAYMQQHVLGLKSSVLVAVPNPDPAEGEVVEAAIKRSLAEAEEQGIDGARVTPFVLKRVNELTHGASLRANIALVKNNAAVGADIAVAMFKGSGRGVSKAGGAGGKGSGGAVKGARGLHTSARAYAPPAVSRASAPGRPLVVGGAVVDFISRPLPGAELLEGTSNPGVVTLSFGGVGRNVADALARLSPECPPALVTALGADAHGRALAAFCEEELQMPVISVTSGAEGSSSSSPARTAVYSALLDGQGELVAAVADTAAFDALVPANMGPEVQALVKAAPLVIVDGNVPAAGVTHVARTAAGGGGNSVAIPSDGLSRPKRVGDASPRGAVPLVYECTSVAKCVRAAEADSLHLVTIVKANQKEVMALADVIRTRLGLPPVSSGSPVGEEPEEEAEGVEQSASSGSVDPELERLLAGAGATVEQPSKRGKAKAAGSSGTSTLNQRVHFEEGSSGGQAEGDDEASRTFTVPGAEGDEGQQVTTRLTDASLQEEGEVDEEEGDESDVLDYMVLTAAQTILAAMVRPGGLSRPLAASSLRAAEKLVADMSSGQAPPNPSVPVPGTPEFFNPEADPLFPGALIDGRKHVLVTLGPLGVLWVSARPAPTDATADLLAALPFFAAARHPAFSMDFQLCNAPKAAQVVKVTGAGDTLLGGVSAGLVGGYSFASSVQLGLAAAKIAVESPVGASTISDALNLDATIRIAEDEVAPVEEEYS